MKKLMTLFLSLMLLLSFAGCGSAKIAYGTTTASADMAVTQAPMEMPAAGEEAEFGYIKGDSIKLKGDTEPSSAVESKMIYRANIELQTLDYDICEKAISELVSSCGGYFEDRSLSNYSSDYRYANFTVRVPVAEYEHFCSQVGELCHVVYMSSSAENISESYYDTASRLETAKIKLGRLQELLLKAETMEDIITIESAISDTEWQIENLSGTLRHYDALVDYATVSLSLSEVYRLAGTESAPLTFGERLWNALKSGVTDAKDFSEDLIISLAGAWVFLLLLAVVLVFLIRFRKRHGKTLLSRCQKCILKRRSSDAEQNTDTEK